MAEAHKRRIPQMHPKTDGIIPALPNGPVLFIVDSTGLKICGQGEWHFKKHGKRRLCLLQEVSSDLS